MKAAAILLALVFGVLIPGLVAKGSPLYTENCFPIGINKIDDIECRLSWTCVDRIWEPRKMCDEGTIATADGQCVPGKCKYVPGKFQCAGREYEKKYPDPLDCRRYWACFQSVQPPSWDPTPYDCDLDGDTYSLTTEECEEQPCDHEYLYQ